MGPTIQQGVIQHPVQQGTQLTDARPRNTINANAVNSINMQQTRMAPPSHGHDNGKVMSDPGEDGRDRLPEHEEDSGHHDYVMRTVSMK